MKLLFITLAVLATSAHSQGLTVYRMGNEYSDVVGRGNPVQIRENTLEVVLPAYVPPLGAVPGPIRPAPVVTQAGPPAPMPTRIIIRVTVPVYIHSHQQPSYRYR